MKYVWQLIKETRPLAKCLISIWLLISSAKYIFDVNDFYESTDSLFVLQWKNMVCVRKQIKNIVNGGQEVWYNLWTKPIHYGSIYT